MRPILALAWAEVLHVVRDYATLAQVLLIPIVQLLVLTNAATFEIRDSPAYVVDLDRTPASRGLVTRFAASGYFRILDQSTSQALANEEMLRGNVTTVLAIPRDFESSLVRTGTAPIQLLMNAEKGPAAGIVQFYAARITASYSAELTQQYQPSSHVVRSTINPDVPVRGIPKISVQARSWYNSTQSYQHYMVPGILVALVTLIGTLMTAQNLAREKELGTLEQLNVTPITRTQFVIAKVLPFWILAMGELAIGIALGKFAFGMPIEGSLLLLFAVAAIYLIGALGIGFWVSTLVDTQQQAMFVTFFIVIIYFLLSGLFTPLDSMPNWVQWIAEFNPVRHFVSISRAILIRGAGLAEIVKPLTILVIMTTVIVILMLRQLGRRAA